MNKKVLSIVIIVFTLFLVTGCNNKAEESVVNKKMIGDYELSEVIIGEAKYTSKEWKKMTSSDYSLEIKNDNTAVISIKGDTQEKEYYTFDKNYFYKKLSKDDEGGKKYYDYEFKDNSIKLSLNDNKYKNIYVYKK